MSFIPPGRRDEKTCDSKERKQKEHKNGVGRDGKGSQECFIKIAKASKNRKEYKGRSKIWWEENMKAKHERKGISKM